MAKPTNPYAGIAIDRNKMRDAVEQLGAINYDYRPNGGMHQLTCKIDNVDFKLAIHEKNDGMTTLQRIGTHSEELHIRVAEQIKNFCQYSVAKDFNVSIPKFPQEHAQALIDYLVAEAGSIELEKSENGYIIVRMKGHYGDTLTIKRYGNGTIQFQGRWAMLATHAQDFLTTVLPYDKAVQAQIDTFDIEISVNDAQAQTAGKLPYAFEHLNSVVAANLTSALIMSKVEMHLPDYGGVAFPALRGLEGFINTELVNSNLNPAAAKDYGEYFEGNGIKGQYVMRAVVAAHVGEPRCSKLVQCYSLYANQRHRIVHMDADPSTSRMISSLDEARRIVDEVFDTINKFYCNL
jgi:hypothetical protein